MKKITSSNSNEYRLATLFIAIFLAAFALFNGAGWLFGWKYVSVFAATEEMDKYEIRSQLLMEALNADCTCQPDMPAELWASGLQKRSGALQYAAMTKALKAEYAKQLDKTFPNWVTGMSSPWIDSYKVSSLKEADEDVYEARVQFVTATSTGPFKTYQAVLTIKQEGMCWKISKIVADKELSAYTGFQQ
jgi:hypothetical protein